MNVHERIEVWAGEPVATSGTVGGGCIAQAEKITLKSGRELFVKSGVAGNSVFEKEANGLRELAKAQALRVPQVLYLEHDFLVLEYIASGLGGKNFFETFGRQFAQMHRFIGESYGFFEDNFIGATVQKNLAEEDEIFNWTKFYFNKRLTFQIRLAEKNGFLSPKLRRGFSKLETRIEQILQGSEEPPCVLHGDLWSGNFMIAESGEAVLIDPAVYYGHREADLAMTMLFGGFQPQFYEAYDEAFPLPHGWRERSNIYKLYNVLNHLNLFGTGYLAQAESLLWGYL
ncbi:MAG: fructosamine kinase family protein [Deferribacteres bacterium]|nr:fructosamine kinase family protein [candidate division KSB1 bacterium]MCB9501199.1 fructosamine kinase family protein [Deferribacteres bacterium]